jgi:hypothetical protein
MYVWTIVREADRRPPRFEELANVKSTFLYRYAKVASFGML